MTHTDLSTVVPPPGWQIEHYAQVGSTNELARERARAGAAGRLALVADEQTAGRGRMGRGWVAPPGSSLLISALLRPDLPGEDAFLLTVAAGLALCDAVERVTSLEAALKWPNDLLLSGPDRRLRKAAGILAELGWEQGRLAWAVIGMGVNVSWSPSGSVDGRDLSETATSLSDAAGGRVERAPLLAALLGALDGWLEAIQASGGEPLLRAWRGRLATLGRPVAVRHAGGLTEGVAEDLGPDGALLVRDAAGALHTIRAGDVEA